MYDLFEYREGFKHQPISNHAEMRSMMTEKVLTGANIHSGGLKPMFHREVPLTIADILYSTGAAVYDETSASMYT